MTVRIGHLSTLYHTSILLMADRSLPDKLGEEAEWTLMGTGPDLVAALGRGELDIAYMGLPPAVAGIVAGIQITCVAGGHEEGTVVVGKARDGGYPDGKDLAEVLAQYRGERIAVPGKGSIHDVILADALAQNGLTAEVEVVHFKWADLITDALADGEVRAAFGTPALAVAARHYAGGKVIWPPQLLWPENPSCGIIATREFINHRPQLLERFLLLHEAATKKLREAPAEAATEISAFVAVVDSGFVRETISLSPRYCAALTPGFINSTMRFVETMAGLGYIDRRVEKEEVFNTSLIDRVHGPGEHYSQGIAQGGL